MGIISSEKIFIEPKEEINFIIDRALNSHKDRIIIVVPQNSILFSSPISVNILYKELAQAGKTSIIVTEDEYGNMIAKKAGFVVLQKVSQITNETWDNSLNRKLRYMEALDQRKQELLSNLGLMDKKTDQEVEPENETIEEAAEIIEEEDLSEEVNADQEEEQIEEETDLPVEEGASESEDIKPEVSDDEAMNFYRKPRAETKVVNLGSISLMAGGDIRNFSNSSRNDRIQDTYIKNDEMNEEIPERRIRNINSNTKAGKDYTKLVSNENSIGSFFDNLLNRNKRSAQTEAELGILSLKNARRRKVIIIASVIAVLALLIFGYVSASQIASVDVTIRFKKEDVTASANVLADPDITEISYNPYIIPAKILVAEKISISKTGEASGQQESGNKAKGFVTIYNLTEEDVTLPKGTKLTNISSNKIYVTTVDVALEAATATSSGTSAFYVDDIAVEAESFGTTYNIPAGGSSTIRLTVEGYQGFDEVYASVPGAIDGGTSESFVSVSKENIDALKEKIIPELEKQGETKLRNSIPTGYNLVSESMKFTETSVSALPKENEKATDGKFTLSVEGDLTIYAVASNDLKSVAERALSDNSAEEDNDLVIDEIDLPQITEVEESERGITFTISTQGSVGLRPSDETIKETIAGRTIESALDYLSTIETIEDYRITFSPQILPEFLRQVPSDQSRINIRTR